MKYIVIENLNEPNDCEIVAEDALYVSIYAKVFGPTSRDECEKWMAENCGHNEQ